MNLGNQEHFQHFSWLIIREELELFNAQRRNRSVSPFPYSQNSPSLMPPLQNKETMHFQKERTPVFKLPTEFQNQRNAWQFGFHKGLVLGMPVFQISSFPCFISGAILFSLSFPSWLRRRKEKRKGFPDKAAPAPPRRPAPHDGKLIVMPGSCTHLPHSDWGRAPLGSGPSVSGL